MTTPASSTTAATPSGLRAWPTSLSLALLVLRIAIGAIIIAHGAQKVFFYGFAGTGGSFAEMGVPLASIAGPVVGLVELIGGVLIVLGLATRVAALAVAIDMLVATILVHLPYGIFIADGGFELTLALLASSIAFVLAGAGRISIDALLTRRRSAQLH
jgi:putative oxidoreductase